MTTSETETPEVVELVPGPKTDLGGRGKGNRQRAGTGSMAGALLSGGGTAAKPAGDDTEPETPAAPHAAVVKGPAPAATQTTEAEEKDQADEAEGAAVLNRVPPQAAPPTEPAPAVADEPEDEAQQEALPRVPPQAVPVEEPAAGTSGESNDDEEQDPDDDEDEDDGWIAPSIASGRRRAEDTYVPDDEFAEVTFQTSLYLAGTDIPKAKKLAKLDRTTHAGVVMDAVDAANEAGVLGELVAAKRTTSRPETSLFPSRRAMRPRATQTGPRGSLFPVQMTESECDVLDNLAGELGAASRSALVSAAMTWYLRTPRVVRALQRKTR